MKNKILEMFRSISFGFIGPKLKVGQVWMFEDASENPFLRNRNRKTVLEIKDGYLRYSWNGTEMTDSISSFRWINRLVEDVED